jgi:hypothetical protein
VPLVPATLRQMQAPAKAATVPAARRLYHRQIDTTDGEIDALVYELYGLTEEEIAIVKGLEH